MERNLIQVKENNLVTTSLLIAEHFDKNHSHVLRDIETLIKQIEENPILDAPQMFEKSQYVSRQNKQLPMYFISQDGFTLLAMGFNGVEALKWKLKYIKAFNEMRRKLTNPTLKDSRLDLARIISRTPARNLPTIRALYPEYFGALIDRDSLAHTVDVNTSYSKWIEDYGITREWIGDFPTADIYNSYVRYCHDNRFSSMGRNEFYKTLENDFNMSRKQKHDGFRYFVTI